MKHTDWLTNVVTTGIQMLVAMGLEGQPARDMIIHTRDLWVKVVAESIGNPNEELDAERLSKGFLKLLGEVTRWPTPKMLIDLLPRRRTVEKLNHEEQMTDDERRNNLEALMALRKAKLGD